MKRSDDTGTHSGGGPNLDRDTLWQHAAQRHYDPDRDGGLTTAIVFAIADGQDVSPSEVKSPSLYETVDVAGIEQAFFGSNTADIARNGTGTVEFRYTDYLVKVRSDGWVQVYEPTEPEQA